MIDYSKGNYYKEKGDKYGTDQMSTLWRGFYD